MQRAVSPGTYGQAASAGRAAAGGEYRGVPPALQNSRRHRRHQQRSETKDRLGTVAGSREASGVPCDFTEGGRLEYAEGGGLRKNAENCVRTSLPGRFRADFHVFVAANGNPPHLYRPENTNNSVFAAIWRKPTPSYRRLNNTFDGGI